MQHRRDNSWGVLDWMELADTFLGLGNFAVELAVEAVAAAFEVAGALFSLLDVF